MPLLDPGTRWTPSRRRRETGPSPDRQRRITQPFDLSSGKGTR